MTKLCNANEKTSTRIVWNVLGRDVPGADDLLRAALDPKGEKGETSSGESMVDQQTAGKVCIMFAGNRT